MMMHMWGMTEDGHGNIYLPQYLYYEGGPKTSSQVDPRQDALQGQYIWTSAQWGALRSWTRKDYLIDMVGPNYQRAGTWGTFRHIHNLKYNPNDSRIYLSAGDEYRAAFVSSDGFASAPTKLDIPPSQLPPPGDPSLTPEDGPTGLTFTKEAVYWGLDLPNSKIISYDSSGSWRTAFTPPQKDNGTCLNNEIWELVAAGNNELWYTTYDSNGGELPGSALVRLFKSPGVDSTWSMDVALRGAGDQVPDAFKDWYLQVSHNGYGIIPETFPYVFVQHHGPGTDDWKPYPVVRVMRPGYLAQLVSSAIAF
jgi:hypothetical protein